MEFSTERAAPYIRALRSGLEALAPHGDHVPLSETTALLAALAPGLSGEVLAPARADPVSGMPDFAWISRALAEQHLAANGDDQTDLSDDAIDRALRLDPELGQRMQARRRLHRFLRLNPILPSSRLIAAVHRKKPSVDITLTWDRLTPSSCWQRLRCTARWPTLNFMGPIQLTGEGNVAVPEGVVHLFSRHAAVPLLGLREQLSHGLGAHIFRLSRSTIGPFWFPGIPVHRFAPDALGTGLLLHLATEILAEDVHQSRHLDPLLRDERGRVPEGLGLFRQRRFAASRSLLEPLADWGRTVEMELQVAPI